MMANFIGVNRTSGSVLSEKSVMKKPYKVNELRNRKAICCMTDKEYTEMKKEISKLGVTMSEYIRRILFDKRAHLLLDSAHLVEWLDRVAIESGSSTFAIRNFVQKCAIESPADKYYMNELISLVAKCYESQYNIGKCMKKLIKLIGSN